MRSRVLLTLTIALLMFCLLACSKQPAENATSSMDNTAATSSAPGEAAGTPSEPAKARTERAKPEARPAVIPSGTVLTVRLGEAVGSKISGRIKFMDKGSMGKFVMVEPMEVTKS